MTVYDIIGIIGIIGVYIMVAQSLKYSGSPKNLK